MPENDDKPGLWFNICGGIIAIIFAALLTFVLCGGIITQMLEALKEMYK